MVNHRREGPYFFPGQSLTPPDALHDQLLDARKLRPALQRNLTIFPVGLFSSKLNSQTAKS